MQKDTIIREISENPDIETSVSVVQKAFKTVADEFHLTKENCPTHSSFITHDKINEIIKKGIRTFGLFKKQEQIGFIAIEKASDDLYYIEKLAVIPENRHNGYGSTLLSYAFHFIQKAGGKRVSIGIIDKHSVLKQWYERFGFKQVEVRKFDHLPFAVCFLEKQLTDAALLFNMLEYYDERALEYEEIYTLGKGPGSIPNPEAYKKDVKILSEIVSGHIKGKIIDIACGTGFWLPFYHIFCDKIYMFEQSLKMISRCKKKIDSLGISDKCSLLNGNFFRFHFSENYFDSALMGFFMSHIPPFQEYMIIEKLKRILKKSGIFLIFDSVWNKERAKIRKKSGKQQRILNNGRQYEIYKRYFSKSDLKNFGKKYNISMEVLHVGKVFIAAKGILEG